MLRYGTTKARAIYAQINSRVGGFGPKIGEEGGDRCKLNFNTICERHGAVVRKRNRVDIFCRLSIMQERDRQTDKETTER